MKRPTNFNQPSPLLELLDQRHKALGLGDGKPYRAPRMTDVRRQQITDVADAYGKAHISDPFARDRIHLHMTRGLELVSDVQKEATSILLAKTRQAASEGEVIAEAA